MGKDAKVYLKTPEFRGSFVNLAKPRSQKKEDGTDGDPKYSLAIVLPKDKPSTKAFILQLKKLLADTYLAKHGKPINPAARGYPIKDGASVGDEGNFEGMWFIRAASNFKPSVCDIHGDKLEGEAELYSGAWYRAKVSAWAWAHATGGKGVSVNIDTAIKTKDDDKFGGGGDAASDFADDLGESTEEDGPSHSMLD